MDTDLEALLKEVEAYMAATGMAHSTLSKAAVHGDGNVIKRMRQGRPVTTKISSKLRQYMEANPPPNTSSEAGA
jgi:hypothetical protein